MSNLHASLSAAISRVFLALALTAATLVGSPAAAFASAVCPPPGTLAQIIALDADPSPLTVEFRPVYGVYAEGAAACWPGTEINLTGFVARPEGLGGVSTFTIEPAWLLSREHALAVTALVDPDAGPIGPFLPVAVPPDLAAKFTSLQGRWVVAKGHFDDPIALTCLVTEGDPSVATVPTPEQAIQICQASFVLTSVEPLITPNTDTVASSAATSGPEASALLLVALAAAVAFGAFVRHSRVGPWKR